MMQRLNDPAIGITIGDPGGIGPEILLKALQKDFACRFLIFGSKRVLVHNSIALNLPLPPGNTEIVDIDNVPNPYFGPNPSISGFASITYLDAAFDAYNQGKIDGLVTGPIHKESWHQAGFHFPGQTEYCASKTNTSDFCMLMASHRFRIALLSTHLSLAEALQRVNRDAIISKIRLLNREFRKLGFPNPKIAVAAVNPHAGEAGAFGEEEAREIEPALRQLRSEGVHVEGPIAPEVIFRVAAMETKKWDVILSMYHDQAMIPLKLIDFEQSANVTIGLPLIRTSPDHGTAFDIAGQGKAQAGSMIYAVQLAIDWTQRLRGIS